MTEHELAMLLTRVQTIDHRVVDRLTLEAWEPIVGPLPYDDCLQAMNDHYASTGDWLMPHHIASGARRLADKRREALHRELQKGRKARTGVGQPPYMAEMEEAAREATRAAIAAGHTHGDEITQRSAFAAALEVQRAWEAEHGTTWDRLGLEDAPAPVPPEVLDPAKARLDRDDVSRETWATPEPEYPDDVPF